MQHIGQEYAVGCGLIRTDQPDPRTDRLARPQSRVGGDSPVSRTPRTRETPRQRQARNHRRRRSTI